MSEPFAYDAVEYPSAGIPRMHPSHLFAVARLFGCRPAPVGRCRYLEYGCGDGTHLIGCAMGLPAATFVGVDLSVEAIARGNTLIAELGVTNVSLHAADATVWTPPAGGFDFACAHGLYSWVPPFVRDAVLAGMHTALTPDGVGYVSYNTYPGCYVRRMVWEILKQHTAHTADPSAKLREAGDMLRFLLAGQPAERKPAVQAFAHEMTQLLDDWQPGTLYHDDLGEVNDPVYFRQFAEHAGRFGLRFVAEAEQVMMNTELFPSAVTGVLDGMADRDVLLKEQYFDYLKLRRFRHTVLAKDGRPPIARPDPAAVADLLVSGLDLIAEAQPEADEMTFRRTGSAVRVAHPLVKAALLTVAEGGPRRVTFDELATAIAARLGQPMLSDDDRTRVCELLAEAWMGGMVDLNGHRPWYFDAVSERPTACPFARARAPVADVVNSRLFTPLNAREPTVRGLLALLDGTRTADEIAAAWGASYPPETRPAAEVLRGRLDNYLGQMARNGMLVG